MPISIKPITPVAPIIPGDPEEPIPPLLPPPESVPPSPSDSLPSVTDEPGSDSGGSNLFIDYTEVFSLIASAGKSSAAALSTLSAIAANVDISTFTSYEECILYRDKLIKDLNFSYNQVLADASAIITMRPPFQGLSDLLFERTGMRPDEYLTANGLQVNPTYAAIEMNISPENIYAV